jgi:hypothetical protein
MTDDTTKRRPQDSTRISLSEDYEVDYWTDKFGVSRDQLKEAVSAVGNSAEAVRNYLGK